MSNKLARTIEYDKFRRLFIIHEIMSQYCKNLETELKNYGKEEGFFTELFEISKNQWKYKNEEIERKAKEKHDARYMYKNYRLMKADK